jgi:Sulfotransferase family
MTGRNVGRWWRATSLSEPRTKAFRRNELLEQLLSELGDDLQSAERALADRYAGTGMPRPLILIMGPLRSGTTLFMQWLADTGLISYPTNLLSRFYRAPIIGAKIQLLLTDPAYQFRDELEEFAGQGKYASENGKTRGALAPNEFWYFWRRFLPEPGRDVWSNDELTQSMDTRTMLAELNGIISVFRKPFAAKGMLFNYNIGFLDAILDKALFIQLTRDPVANVASVLEARRRQHGSVSTWYSFKLPEYQQLQRLDPVMQAAGQVHYINRAVAAGMSALPEARRMSVHYEEFCKCPRNVFRELCEKLSIGPLEYEGAESFEVPARDLSATQGEIRRALDHFLEAR